MTKPSHYVKYNMQINFLWIDSSHKENFRVTSSDFLSKPARRLLDPKNPLLDGALSTLLFIFGNDHFPFIQRLNTACAVKKASPQGDHKKSRHRVAALAKGTTIVCLLHLATKHLVIAVSVNIK